MARAFRPREGESITTTPLPTPEETLAVFSFVEMDEFFMHLDPQKKRKVADALATTAANLSSIGVAPGQIIPVQIQDIEIMVFLEPILVNGTASVRCHIEPPAGRQINNQGVLIANLEVGDHE